MVKIEFPGFYLPGFKIRKGALLWVNVLGVDLVIPPWDITFWEGRWIWEKFTIWDSDLVWAEVEKVIAPIKDPLSKAVADAQKAILDPLTKIAPDLTTKLGEVRKALEDPIGTLSKTVDRILPAVEKGLADVTTTIPGAVWDLFQARLDEMAREYYERHPEEKAKS